MPVFIVNFRGIATLIVILFCFGVAPRTTALALFVYFAVRLYLWGLRVGDRFENWKYRRGH